MRFSEGLVAAKKDGKWGYLDKTGEVVVPFEFDAAGDFSGGYARVYKDGKYGILKNPLTAAPTVPMATPSTQTVVVDGKAVEFAMYALKDAKGDATNYIRVRDLAAILNGTAAQFDVGWDGNVNLLSKRPYTGAVDKAPFHTEMAYSVYDKATNVDGVAKQLDAISIQYNGGHTYYKLRDLGRVLGFNVGWSAERGIFVETDKPYDPSN